MRHVAGVGVVGLMLGVVGCSGVVGGGSVKPELFGEGGTVPLEVLLRGAVDRGRFRVVDLEYRSAEGGTVPATLYEPTEPAGTSAPGLILLHGVPGNRGSLSRLAGAYAGAGVYALAISAPWVRFTEDRPWRLVPAPSFTEQDSADVVQLVHDLRRAIDLLRADSRIDASRIGFIGHSFGGTGGALLRGVEDRMGAMVLMAPTPGWVSTIAHYQRTTPKAFWLQPFQELPPGRRAGWLASLRPFEATGWIDRLEGVPLLIQGAVRDQRVPREDVTALFEAAAAPKSIAWYDATHRFGPEAFTDQARFLAEHLGFSRDRFVAPMRM